MQRRHAAEVEARQGQQAAEAVRRRSSLRPDVPRSCRAVCGRAAALGGGAERNGESYRAQLQQALSEKAELHSQIRGLETDVTRAKQRAEESERGRDAAVQSAGQAEEQVRELRAALEAAAARERLGEAQRSELAAGQEHMRSRLDAECRARAALDDALRLRGAAHTEQTALPLPPAAAGLQHEASTYSPRESRESRVRAHTSPPPAQASPPQASCLLPSTSVEPRLGGFSGGANGGDGGGSGGGAGYRAPSVSGGECRMSSAGYTPGSSAGAMPASHSMLRERSLLEEPSGHVLIGTTGADEPVEAPSLLPSSAPDAEGADSVREGMGMGTASFPQFASGLGMSSVGEGGGGGGDGGGGEGGDASLLDRLREEMRMHPKASAFEPQLQAVRQALADSQRPAAGAAPRHQSARRRRRRRRVWRLHSRRASRSSRRSCGSSRRACSPAPRQCPRPLRRSPAGRSSRSYGASVCCCCCRRR